MAVTKIWPIYSNLSYSLDYISKDEKTAEQTLLTYQLCSKENALEDFNQIIEDSRASNRHLPDGKRVLARHLVQSFKPGEIDPFTAHQIGMELAEKHLQGKYQFIVSTHVDRDHIHNHIIFNNVSFIDFHCYNSNKKSYQKIRDLSDEICKEHGLEIVMQIDKEKTEKYPYATESRYKNTYRDILRKDIDQAVKQAIDFEDYLILMREKNYEIKQGKYISYRHKKNGQKRFIRDRSLGEEYLKDSIIYRIDQEFLDLDSPLVKLPISNRRLEAIIDLDSDDKFKTSPGLKHWAIKQNNNRFMETMNQMIRLGIGSEKQLNRYVADTQIKKNELDEAINHEKSKLKELGQSQTELTPIFLLINTESESKTYIKLNSKIIDVFERNNIYFEIEDFNSIKIDDNLIIQLEDAIEENKKTESAIKSTLSELIDKKGQLEDFDKNAKYILKNYNLFMGRNVNITHSKNK